MLHRSASVLRVWLIASLSIPAYGQTTELPSGDRFADSLQELQQRLDALETQNARLESVLKVQSEANITDEPEASETLESADDATDSLESLLKAHETTDERLNKIEEGIKKDAEAARKKKEEEAKKERGRCQEGKEVVREIYDSRLRPVSRERCFR